VSCSSRWRSCSLRDLVRVPSSIGERDTRCLIFGQGEVIRNGQWLSYGLRSDTEVITPVPLDQALRLGSLYQLLSVVFIRVIQIYLSYWFPVLIRPSTRRFPTGTASTDPSLGSLVVHLLHLSGSSTIFPAGRCKLVDLVECKNQLCFHIWSVCCLFSLFDILIRKLELDIRTRLGHCEYFEVADFVLRSYYLLITHSATGNPLCNSRVCILAIFLAYWCPNYLATRMDSFRACGRAPSYTRAL
jgi:hypothetical protein